MKRRTTIFYKDYFENFFVEQKQKVKDKIVWTLELIEELPKIPETYLNILQAQKGSMKLEYNLAMIYLESFAFLTKVI